MKAVRKLVRELQRGDQVLTPYHPRTWQSVVRVTVSATGVLLDTKRDRTFWYLEEEIPWKPQPTSEGQ
jgi:hypothetical protein